jgi:hypothetical protein
MCFIYLYENRTMMPVKIILSRGRGIRKSDGGGKPNQGTLCAYMEIPQ